MPKILITGNGFDLNFGLPTSYSDFIKILNFIQDNNIDFDSIYSNSNNYDKILEKFKQFDFKDDIIDILISETKKNLWYNFFKKEFEIETWIDFENKIEYVLDKIFSSIDYINDNVFSKGSIDDFSPLNYNIDIFKGDMEIIDVLNNFKIIDRDRSSFITINKEFLIEKYEHYIGVDLAKISDLLLIELNSFKKIFIYYFEIFVYPFYDNLKVKIDRDIYSAIHKHYTFNYTPTFEKYYRSNKNTNYLHGKIDLEKNNIVLGINEIPNTKFDKRYFIPFTKYFQKLNNNTDYIFIKEFEKLKTKSYNFMFFFLGHSLDKSDADYINEIFNFINELKSKLKQIIVIYHTKEAKGKLLINLLNIRGKDDIQELMRSNILIFRHIDSKELKIDLKKEISKSKSIL